MISLEASLRTRQDRRKEALIELSALWLDWQNMAKRTQRFGQFWMNNSKYAPDVHHDIFFEEDEERSYQRIVGYIFYA